VRRDRATLSRRIAAWGKANGYTIAALQLIGDIQVTATNSVGRPTQITVTDVNGRAFPLKAEPFRWACNYDAPGLPDESSSPVRSSHVAVTVTQYEVLINGAGYGHGVGLCQYSIQAMAKAGYAAPGMLKFFYPGAELRQVY
jgi:stage II sporulation protein D